MKICVILNNNNAVISWGEIVNDVVPHPEGIVIETDLDINSINISKNYKVENNKLVELTEEEKESLFSVEQPQPTKEELLEKQLLETQALVANLQEQILMKDGGIA